MSSAEIWRKLIPFYSGILVQGHLLNSVNFPFIKSSFLSFNTSPQLLPFILINIHWSYIIVSDYHFSWFNASSVFHSWGSILSVFQSNMLVSKDVRQSNSECLSNFHLLKIICFVILLSKYNFHCGSAKIIYNAHHPFSIGNVPTSDLCILSFFQESRINCIRIARKGNSTWILYGPFMDLPESLKSCRLYCSMLILHYKCISKDEKMCWVLLVFQTCTVDGV
jgi:hypothetical protein